MDLSRTLAMIGLAGFKVQIQKAGLTFWNCSEPVCVMILSSSVMMPGYLCKFKENLAQVGYLILALLGRPAEYC